MRKATQPEGQIAEIKISDTAAKNIIPLLDTKGADRHNLVLEHEQVQSTIESFKSEIERYIAREKALKERIEAMPDESMTREELQKILEDIAKLPWVEVVAVQGNYMTIKTRKGGLETRFFSGIKYFEGVRQEFVLDKPTYAAMPQYFIRIGLHALRQGFDKNLQAVAIQFADPSEFNDFIPDCGLNHHLNAHWGCNSDPFGWDDLCLGGYASVFDREVQKGLPELLGAVAMYLQSSGWSSAYRSRIQWAATLGFKPFNDVIWRKAENMKEIEDTYDEYRQDVRNITAKQGISLSMFQHGSDDVGSDDPDDYDSDNDPF